MSDPRDDAKKKILARRASFIAAALASVACQKEPAERPEPCLAVPIGYQPPDASPEPPPPQPQVCLTPMVATPVDAGPPAVEPEPQPCLKVAPPPRDAGRSPGPPGPPPRPCLTPLRPEEKK